MGNDLCHIKPNSKDESVAKNDSTQIIEMEEAKQPPLARKENQRFINNQEIQMVPKTNKKKPSQKASDVSNA